MKGKADTSLTSGLASGKHDLVDRLIADWEREVPELETGGIAVVGRVLQLSRLFEQRINALLKPFGLIYTDFDVLATLRRSGQDFCMTPTELREAVILTSGAMTAALNRLERMGLITRLRTESDRRSLTAKLTPAGIALIERLLNLRFEEAKSAIAALNKSEQQSVAANLRKVVLSLSHEPSDAAT